MRKLDTDLSTVFTDYQLLSAHRSSFRNNIQDAIELDADLLANSERSLETLVEVGMTLGVSKRSPSQTEIPILDKCRLEDWSGKMCVFYTWRSKRRMPMLEQ